MKSAFDVILQELYTPFACAPVDKAFRLECTAMHRFGEQFTRFDRSASSEDNCSYVNPVEVRQARQAPGLHGWRQNIYLLPAVLFPHWEKA